MPRPSLRRHSTLAAVRAAATARRAAPVEDEPVRVQEDVLRDGDVTGLQRRLKFVVTGEIRSTAADSRSIEVPQLRQLAELARCPDCEASCSLSADCNRVVCTACDEVVMSLSRAPVLRLDGSLTQRNPDKIRRVYDSLVNGGGFAGFISTSRNTGQEGMTKQHYHEYCNFLFSEMTSLWDRHRRQLQDSMKRGLEEFHVLSAADGILEIDISYDGTWMTRGHLFEVISNFCQECVKKKSRSTPEEFTAWKATHQQHCMQNFEGKSGAMDVEAALRLWKRSETLGYRYTAFISDGDSASFNAVSALNDGACPYRTAKVSKMECVNHVSKWMGTRLLQLKKELLARNNSHAHLKRVAFAASVMALEHNVGPVHGNLLSVMGLLTEKSLQKREREESTPRRTPVRKRKRPAPQEPSTSYTPGGF